MSVEESQKIPTALLASFLGAVLMGAGDFYSGLASRSLAVSVVALCGQLIGFIGVYLLVGILGVQFSLYAFKCGLAAGVCGAVAILCLYRGLAVGKISVVAPLSALVGAIVPVVVSVLTGHHLGSLTWVAIVLAFIAIYILSLPAKSEADSVEESEKKSSGFLLGLLAGLATGGFYTFFGNADVHGNIWTICGERTVIVSILLSAVLTRKVEIPRSLYTLRYSLLGGACDFGSNALYLYSAAFLSLHVVALITSLYPVSTIILGWLILKEPLTKRLGFGLALAMVSIGIFAVVES